MSPATAKPGRRRLLLAAALLTCCLLGAGAVWWGTRSEPLAAPPSVDLAGLDEPVAHVLEQARERVRQGPRSAAAWGSYGMVLGGYGLRPEAIQCFAAAEQLDPREPRWPYFRGVALQMDGADQEALAPLRRAAQLCPDEPDMPRLRLAELLFRLGQEDEAEDHFRRLLAGQPSHPRALLGWARLAAARGDWQAAQRRLGPCLDSPAVRKSAHLLLAEVEYRLGDARAGRRALEQASALPADAPWPDPFQAEIEILKWDRPSRVRHGLQLRRGGRRGEADALLAELEQDYPGTGAFLEGQRLLEAGNTEAGVAALREAVRQTPDFAQAHYWLGVALRRRKDNRAAAASFRAAAQLQPRHPAAYEQLGLCLRELGDSAGALDAFRAAVLYSPQKAEVHRQLGILLAEAGRKDEACVHLRQALALQPDDRQAWELLERISRDGQQ